MRIKRILKRIKFVNINIKLNQKKTIISKKLIY